MIFMCIFYRLGVYALGFRGFLCGFFLNGNLSFIFSGMMFAPGLCFVV